MTVHTPLISIITITYNAAGVLRPTMDSVATQTMRDFEHIVIDGASKDSTVEIANSYPDTKVISETDKGLYDAMNKGLHRAKGKYVLFLNAGDSFHSPDTLSIYSTRCLKDDEIIAGDTVIVDSDRRILYPRHLSVPQRLDFKSFASGMMVCHQAFMVKRELAPDYDLAYKFSADYDWTANCLKNADPKKCTNLHCVTIDYLSDGMTDKNKWKSLAERFQIMAKHYGVGATILRHIGFVGRALIRGHV